jgi:membrane associated rhomboid family serine protease
MIPVPVEDDPLRLLSYELCMGPTAALPVAQQPLLALLRTPDQISHMLLLRPGADLKHAGRLMRELRHTGLEVLLCGGSVDDRLALFRARPRFAGRGIRILHLGEDGALWVEPTGLGGSEGPLSRALRSRQPSLLPPDWDAFRQRTEESAARLAQETTSFAKLLAARRPIVTWALAATIAAVFALQLTFRASQDTHALVRMGALLASRVQAGELWRLVSCTFLHAGVLHVALNTFVLLAIGLGLERLLGSARTLLIYLVAALGGSLASLALTKSVSVGASGALWGLMAAQFVVAWRSKNVLPEHMKRAVLRSAAQNLGLNLVNSFRPGVDWAAHIGGGIAGGLVMLALVGGLPRMVAAPGAEPHQGALRAGWPLRLGAALSAAILALGLGLGLARGQVWKLAEPPRYERLTLPQSGWTVEIPTELRLQSDANPDPDKPESVFGDLVEDPAVVDVILLPMPLDPSALDAAYGDMQQALDKATPPDGAKKQGPTAERRVGPRRILERRYRFDSGVVASSMVEITVEGFRRVDFVRRESLDVVWQGVGEHALFSLEPGPR